MEKYLKKFKSCLQKEIPFCTAECPFHFDVLDFIEKMKRGGFTGAFKTYRNAVGFPLIASSLCSEPCKEVCPGSETENAVELLMLEKASISFAGDTGSTDYNLPMKKKKAAVIGAGISGLACALRLCMKKYEVEIFESKDRIGGSLWELMKPEVFLPDIEEQFKHETYSLHLNTPIRTVDDVSDYHFDAVYVATGDRGADFGLLSASGPLSAAAEKRDKYCAIFGDTGWFAGGGLIGEEPIYALAKGLQMGTVIDNFLKTGNLLYPENIRNTGMCFDPMKHKLEAVISPAGGEHYNEEEAKKEASRCLECQCDYCRTYCDLTEFYNKWPLRIRDEVVATTLPGSADVKATPAKRLMSTCSQCGLCKETCPQDIDLGGLILEGRKSMHQQKKVPWVFHDFWLRDMDFANSDRASISKNHGVGSCNYAFFPGCQLGASDPELVESSYRYLREKEPDTGLMLRCCGAPAEWSGDEAKFERELAAIRMSWEELGCPTMILACPTCEKKFKTYLTDIPVISLYEIIADWGMKSTAPNPDQDRAMTGNLQEPAGKVYSVFDACSARHEKEMKQSVRTLAVAAGYLLEPLRPNETYDRCCSFGGQSGIANPEYSDFVVRKRISESENPYITYCINCRDVFLDAGKEAVHLLDILFGGGKTSRKLATVSQRRENRKRLKRDILKEHWNIKMDEECKESDGKVRISKGLADKLSREKILEEDVIEVLDFCECTGRRVYHPDRETYGGYMEVGYTTYWVEYKVVPEDGSYDLINAYAHRMKIELEPVWNGRKTDSVDIACTR